MQYLLEKNGPIIAARMRDSVVSHRSVGAFNVVTCSHDGSNRVYPHLTLKAAFRRLSSVANCTRGKLWQPSDFAACIVTPDMRVMNWTEVKAAMKESAQ